MARWTQFQRRIRARNLIAALTCFAQMITATGLPMPVLAHPSRDRRTPYPCMDRPCGCASAEDCWRNCQCFTARERLAWAEAHGVEAPDYLREAAAREAPDNEGSCGRCRARLAPTAREPATKRNQDGRTDQSGEMSVRFVLGI